MISSMWSLPMAKQIPAAMLLLLVVGCTRPQDVSWCTSAESGVEVAASTGPGVWEREGEPRTLVELWRAGGLNEEQNLAYPVALSAGPSGHVAIPDFQLSQVIVVGPDGTWLGRWGRRGRGPGELATPVAATWSRDSMLAVFDVVASKVLFLEVGEPAEADLQVDPSFTAPIVASGQLPWAGVQPDGGILVQPKPEPIETSPGLRAALLLRLGPHTSTPDTLVRAQIRTLSEGRFAGWSLPAWPRLIAAIGTDGAIAVNAAEPAYRITVLDSTGDPVRVICRQAPPQPVTDRERGAEASAPPQLRQAMEAAPHPDSAQSFGRLFWGAHGRLWVQRDRPAPLEDLDGLFGAPGALYDVFGEDGRYLGDLRAPPGVRLQSAAGDTVWGLEFGQFDEAWVVAYGIEGGDR